MLRGPRGEEKTQKKVSIAVVDTITSTRKKSVAANMNIITKGKRAVAGIIMTTRKRKIVVADANTTRRIAPPLSANWARHCTTALFT